MAMNGAVLLAEENRQLRAINAKQVKKRAIRRTFLATGGTLIVQEGLELVQKAIPVPKELESTGGTDESIGRTRAPRTCSMCKSLSHTARTCPLKLVS